MNDKGRKFWKLIEHVYDHLPEDMDPETEIITLFKTYKFGQCFCRNY